MGKAIFIKGDIMDHTIATNQDLIVSNMLEIQAIIRILTKKGITIQDEIMEEIKMLKVELYDKVKKSSKEN